MFSSKSRARKIQARYAYSTGFYAPALLLRTREGKTLVGALSEASPIAVTPFVVLSCRSLCCEWAQVQDKVRCRLFGAARACRQSSKTMEEF